jgi:signal transduction histidine kinase
VTFSVADTGIGIASEHVGALFNDFVQVEAPIQKRLRGTGLGLSLSRKLALLLGGDVAVQSTLGQGSTFSVTIPLQLPVSDAGSGAAVANP